MTIASSIDIILSNKDKKRFLDKVDIKDSDLCWNWLGGYKGNGYGQFYLDHRVISAHRVSWVLFNGPIDPGLFVLHKCDNPSCCNPSHLYLGTHCDNMADRSDRNPHKTGRNPLFSKNDILYMEHLSSSGNTQRQIAEIMGTCQSVIWRILTGKYNKLKN